MIDVNDQLSAASASLVSLAIISFTSLIFGLILGFGFTFTAALDTADHETRGFILLMVGFIGFLITIGITIIKGERRRSQLLAQQSSF